MSIYKPFIRRTNDSNGNRVCVCVTKERESKPYLLMDNFGFLFESYAYFATSGGNVGVWSCAAKGMRRKGLETRKNAVNNTTTFYVFLCVLIKRDFLNLIIVLGCFGKKNGRLTSLQRLSG